MDQHKEGLTKLSTFARSSYQFCNILSNKEWYQHQFLVLIKIKCELQVGSTSLNCSRSNAIAIIFLHKLDQMAKMIIYY